MSITRTRMRRLPPSSYAWRPETSGSFLSLRVRYAAQPCDEGIASESPSPRPSSQCSLTMLQLCCARPGEVVRIRITKLLERHSRGKMARLLDLRFHVGQREKAHVRLLSSLRLHHLSRNLQEQQLDPFVCGSLGRSRRIARCPNPSRERAVLAASTLRTRPLRRRFLRSDRRIHCSNVHQCLALLTVLRGRGRRPVRRHRASV